MPSLSLPSSRNGSGGSTGKLRCGISPQSTSTPGGKHSVGYDGAQLLAGRRRGAAAVAHGRRSVGGNVAGLTGMLPVAVTAVIAGDGQALLDQVETGIDRRRFDVAQQPVVAVTVVAGAGREGDGVVEHQRLQPGGGLAGTALAGLRSVDADQSHSLSVGEIHRVAIDDVGDGDRCRRRRYDWSASVRGALSEEHERHAEGEHLGGLERGEPPRADAGGVVVHGGVSAEPSSADAVCCCEVVGTVRAAAISSVQGCTGGSRRTDTQSAVRPRESHRGNPVLWAEATELQPEALPGSAGGISRACRAWPARFGPVERARPLAIAMVAAGRWPPRA